MWVAEGEKDCDAMAAEGEAATTNFDGAGKWKRDYTETLDGCAPWCRSSPTTTAPARTMR